MMNKFVEFLMKPYINLVFALFCGANYAVVIHKFIQANTVQGASLLTFFFLPVIVAGGGLVVLKSLKNWKEQGMYKYMNILVILNFVLFFINIVSLTAEFIVKI